VGAHFDRLSFVFPAWNEQEMLQHTVAAAREAGDHLVDIGEVADFEIVLVDDGSTDRTPELADELASLDHRVRAVHHERNRGLGAAVRSGVGAATGDVILYTDADLPFDLLLTAKALRLLRIYDADIVSAYRFDRTGEGPKRFLFSHVYNWLVRTVLWVRVRDVNFAGKLLRREVFDHVTLESEGSFIDVELLGTAERLGFHIVQFGVDYFPRTRGTSTLASGAVIRQMVTDLLRSRRRLRRLQPLSEHTRRPVNP
jgi:glycosyltransferase involved in cell wall biosynthesis